MVGQGDLTPIYQAAGQEWNVDPALLQAIGGQETGGLSNPDQAVSPKGAQGRQQLMPGTAQEMGVENPADPVQNIYGSAKYLSQMLDRYKDQPDPAKLAVAAYDAGPGRVDDYLAGKAVLPAETVKYVPGVAQRYQAISAPQQPQQPQQPQATAPVEVDPYTAALNAAKSAPVSTAQPTQQAPASDPYSQALEAAQKAATPPAPAAPSATPPAVTDPAAMGGQSLLDHPLQAVGGQIVNMAEGAGHAVQQASNALYTGIDALNKAYPVGSNTAGGLINAPAALANLSAQDQAYQASGTGNTIGGMAGSLVGQGVVAAPVTGAVGAGANLLASGARAVAPELAGNALARLAGYGVSGGAQGAAFGAVNSNGQNVGQNALTGAIGGGALGAGLPAIGGALRSVGGTVANALSDISPDTAALAQKAKQAYGIDVRPAQMMPDGFIKTADNQLSRLPGTGGAAANAQQIQQFTGAVAKTIDPSATTNTITRDFMQQQRKRIGDVLNDIESNHDISFDPQFQNDLAQIETNAHTVLEPDQSKAVSNLINQVISRVQPGDTISGETFGNLIHKGSPLDSATDSNRSNIAAYAQDIQDALRGAMQRSLPPDEAQAYQDARFQYKNLMTVAPLVDKTQPGVISPAALQQRVAQNFGPKRIFSPATPLDELGQIGQRFLKEPANSGTPDRQVINRLVVNPMGAISGLAALGSSAINAPITTALSAAGAGVAAGVGGALTRGVANTLRSNYLANRLTAAALGQAAPSALPNMLAGSPATGALLANRLMPQQSGQ